ncbi:MAG: HAMP domain-containing sensor histidine kinase [Myxococcota bacterium]
MDDPSPARGLPAWTIAWAATLLAALSSATALGIASVAVLSDALDVALGDELGSQAGLVGAAAASLPLDTVVLLGGERTTAEVRARLAALATGGRLHDVALLRPTDGAALGPDRARGFVAAEADADLVALAAAGQPQVGPQYRGTDGAWYRAAYAPVPGHDGWVAAVEGSDATLGAVDRLRRTQIAAGLGALVVAGGLATVAATVVSRPLRRLAADLGRTPATADGIAVQGPREVRTAAVTARTLLDALAAAHEERVREIEALAAAVAHEVRNPLNALAMALERLGLAPESRRAVLLARTQARVVEIDGIVQRFLDVSAPIHAVLEDLDLAAVAADVAPELDGLRVTVTGAGRAHADPGLVRQILRNLLRNAHEAGATAVAITVAPAALAVQDDGPGVDPALVDRLFDWFASGRAAGTGLGLAASLRAARAQGGDLTLASPKPARFLLSLREEAADAR